MGVGVIIRHLSAVLHRRQHHANIQLKTYGRLFAISRQALINDDLDALGNLPRGFGASAARPEADLTYAMLIDNPEMPDGNDLFSVAHLNLATGAGVPSVATLNVGFAAMRKQKGPAGLSTLNIAPQFLIVPAAFEGTARELLTSTFNPASGSFAANIFNGRLEIVVDAQLDASSATAWYLAANPTSTDTVCRGYLQGQRGVTVQERDGWNIDALELKARLDFGVAALDYRGLYKHAGT